MKTRTKNLIAAVLAAPFIGVFMYLYQYPLVPTDYQILGADPVLPRTIGMAVCVFFLAVILFIRLGPLRLVALSLLGVLGFGGWASLAPDWQAEKKAFLAYGIESIGENALLTLLGVGILVIIGMIVFLLWMERKTEKEKKPTSNIPDRPDPPLEGSPKLRTAPTEEGKEEGPTKKTEAPSTSLLIANTDNEESARTFATLLVEGPGMIKTIHEDHPASVSVAMKVVAKFHPEEVVGAYGEDSQPLLLFFLDGATLGQIQERMETFQKVVLQHHPRSAERLLRKSTHFLVDHMASMITQASVSAP